MAFTPSQRKTHEWPRLLLALVLVGAVCIPLWQRTSGSQSLQDQLVTWTPQRVGQLLLGPEQIACYCCCTWAGLILFSRWMEVRRQRRAFKLGLLPTEEGSRILPEDARPLVRRLDQLTGRTPYILANMIRLALGKYAVSRTGRDVSETVRTQAEVDMGRLVSSMATVHYLAWAIPAIGFLGTVRGLAMSVAKAGQTLGGTPASQAEGQQGFQQFFDQVAPYLNTAFDTTLIALALSLVLMFLIHTVQRDEESVVIDSQQYCLEHLVNRLYDLDAVEPRAAESPAEHWTVGAGR